MQPSTSAPAAPAVGRFGLQYKWLALSNTTLGILMAMINASIVIISLPAVFRGIDLNPLEPGNVSYLLWMLMGYLLVSAVLVVSLGRLGDMYGRVRMYNAGFVVFTAASVALALTPFGGSRGALWLIAFRVVQGIGGALLMANSTAIITDAFPITQRGFALGVNQVAALAGSFIGLVLGGVLAEWHWRMVFWVSVPIGVVGTVWAYHSLHDTGVRRAARIDWWGNLTFGVGLIALLAGITYGIQPYGGHRTGWTNPWVLTAIIGGLALLVAFVFVERVVDDPMVDLRLFRNGTFVIGNSAALLASIARGGMQFMLIIWLQGIWLPLRGYSFESTPLWAGIYLLPLTIGFLVAGPLSGWLSDHFGPRPFAVGGMLITALSFVGLVLLPVNFSYAAFAALLALNGIGSGLFTAPNTTAVMNSVPAHERGAASGIRATVQNAGMVLSMGMFFSLMVLGLSGSLPHSMTAGLTAHGVPLHVATQLAAVPPVGLLFAAFLGFNPIATLLGPVLATLPHDDVAALTGQAFFPQLLGTPFHDGLVIVFGLAAVMSLVAALLSLRHEGGRHEHAVAAGAARRRAREARAAAGDSLEPSQA